MRPPAFTLPRARAGASPAPAALLPDADFLRLKAELIRRTGHFYYEDKDELLWERVRRRLRALNLGSAGAYLERLAAPGLGEAEWAALEAEITIGETFFFRYAEQFAALRETILPEILHRNRESRRLRVWSAGCANGAEPYSLAILLQELLGEALPDWRITLLGTDLNEASLASARQGVFSAWSLRGMAAEQRERDFQPEGRHWRLRPRHRALVRFQRHNLMDLLAEEGALGMDEFDLILCRNVLIYFHPEVVPALVRALAGRLVQGGWLLLGHAEPNPAFARFLQPVTLPGTAAWRREGEAIAPLAPAHPAEAPATPGEPIHLPLVPAAQARAAPLTPIAWPPPAPGLDQAPPPPLPPAGLVPFTPLPPLETLLHGVRQRADGGDLEGAALACQEALAREPASPALHFYAALLHQARSQAAEAEHAFRRALALRENFAMAHYHLGLLLLGQGRAAPGRKALAAAARIVHALPDTALLEEGDGMTAGELREAARLRLELR